MQSNLMSPYQQFIHLSRYARFRDDLGRRENWSETVDRYVSFFQEHLAENNGYTLTESECEMIRTAIYDQEAMPSMRCLMTAGEALKRENLAGFNCSYVAVDDKAAFSEALYILMCGTGVGFSVERQYVKSLPEVPTLLFEDHDAVITVQDSKLGWAEAFRDLIDYLYGGIVPDINTDLVRPAGARLKVFGGRASGPGPLRDLFNYTIEKFRNAAGRRLSSLECHDIMCMVGHIVVVGGVRRSAMISLSNLSDDRMRNAKSGEFYVNEKQRFMANNSAAYTERPDTGAFMEEWTALYRSRSGERGIFNRYSAEARVAALPHRETGHEWGTNPCGEIILRPQGLCNLSEAVVRPDDDYEDLRRKVGIATILGTLQSTLTNYGFVRDVWVKNSQEERLLGVSLTGQLSNTTFHDASPDSHARQILRNLRKHARKVNAEWAKKLGIPPSAAISTVKPSGTVSQFVNSPSGMHPAHSEYYERRVRADIKDPMTQFLQEAGVKWEPCNTNPDAVVIFSFPIHMRGMTRHDLSAIQHLEIVHMFATEWTDHNPSCTISVRENEWPGVGAWVWDNFDEIGGLSFLPMSDHVYDQAPYEDLTKGQYEELLKNTPSSLDWQRLADIEGGNDNVVNTKELACSAGVCEVVDIATR